jgi:glycine dehydrogenase subunit 1
MPYIPNTDEDRKEMLERIGVSQFSELLSEIPEELRFKGEYSIGKALSEFEVKKKLSSIASKNRTTNENISFLGGGIYDHFIPSVVNTISSRSEFYTAYTPYQPEVSQGTLQAIYEFQSMICDLFAMEVANASMYDGATALAEAAHMAVNINNRSEIVMCDSIHPHYQKTVRTFTKGVCTSIHSVPISDKGRMDPGELKKVITEKTSAVLIQHPNFFGILEEMDEIEKIVHEKGALLVMDVHPLTMGLIKPPGEYNADIAVGEGQPLGITQSYGGPLLGLFTARKEYIRRMPGRIIAETVDIDGKRGFVMTLQTREQHIRREKATSNICTNEGLCALRAAVYLTLLGTSGIKEVAQRIFEKAHYLAGEMRKSDRYRLAFPDSPFFQEFVVRTEKPAEKLLEGLEKEGIFGGFNLGTMREEWKNTILIAVTEKRTKEEMDRFISILNSLS